MGIFHRQKQQNQTKRPSPFVLVVLDGWGHAPAGRGNAVTLAKTPHLSLLAKKYPSTLLKAAGVHVGLPKGQHGNSEAGHLNLGAGRVVLQDASYISQSIADGTFYKNSAFLAALHHVKKHHSALHLMGLLTGHHSGHAIPEHLFSLLRLASQYRVENVVVHLFTDGRDTPLRRAIPLLAQLEAVMDRYGVGCIGTIMGRFYMDRAKRWDRTITAYHAMVMGTSQTATSAMAAVKAAYQQGKTDEFIEPVSIACKKEHRHVIKDDDAIICFNLRSDRARQLTKPFVQKDFCERNGLKNCLQKRIRNLTYVAMTDFGPDLDSVLTAYPSRDVQETLPMQLADFRQMYISESEKYAHTTYFFNGGYQDPVAGEQRMHIPSKRVISFEEKPEMSAKDITKAVVKALKNGTADFICVNYANMDMVGHTGNLVATIRAVEVVDAQIGKLYDAIQKKNGMMAIVGDHGNAEKMLEGPNRVPHSHHTSNPVPFIVMTPKGKRVGLRKNGVLGNVAPTILDLLEHPIPKGMLPSLLIRKKSPR